MTKTDDGGPAFAALATSASDDVHHQPGMSLRDWFAGQALVGVMMSARGIGDLEPADRSAIWERTSALLYEAADAMLSHRSKGRADT